jgi:hypothetical protein
MDRLLLTAAAIAATPANLTDVVFADVLGASRTDILRSFRTDMTLPRHTLR